MKTLNHRTGLFPNGKFVFLNRGPERSDVSDQVVDFGNNINPGIAALELDFLDDESLRLLERARNEGYSLRVEGKGSRSSQMVLTAPDGRQFIRRATMAKERNLKMLLQEGLMSPEGKLRSELSEFLQTHRDIKRLLVRGGEAALLKVLNDHGLNMEYVEETVRKEKEAMERPGWRAGRLFGNADIFNQGDLYILAHKTQKEARERASAVRMNLGGGEFPIRADYIAIIQRAQSRGITFEYDGRNLLIVNNGAVEASVRARLNSNLDAELADRLEFVLNES